MEYLLAGHHAIPACLAPPASRARKSESKDTRARSCDVANCNWSASGRPHRPASCAVKMSTPRWRSPWATADGMCWSRKNWIGSATQLLLHLGRVAVLQRLNRMVLAADVLFDLVAVVEVVRQGGVDVGQRDAREHRHDLVG